MSATKTAAHKRVQISHFLHELAGKNAAARERARHELARMGGLEVLRGLFAALVSCDRHERWEAAKTLAELSDPAAAPALVNALEDNDEDVRWVAAEGLAALGRPGLIAVLDGVTRRSKSVDFCKAAHHALHTLRQKGWEDAINPVLAALDTPEPQITAPPEAFQALQKLHLGLSFAGPAE